VTGQVVLPVIPAYGGVMLPTPDKNEPVAAGRDTGQEMVDSSPATAADLKPAPEPLNRVQALINTINLTTGIDSLADPVVAQPLLEAQGLLLPGYFPTYEELFTIRGYREALRALLIQKSGGPAFTEQQLAPLRSIAYIATAYAYVDDEGGVGMAPVGDWLPGRLVALLLIIAEAQRNGTWARLKACANEDCRRAFYDRSRNQGGTWCDMSSCGNKLKNRVFRARKNSREPAE
jgi:predicted RNA-binding Zn ribbon-like protein